MWLICLVSAGSLTLIDTVYDLIFYKTAMPVVGTLKKEPYELIPFVLSMFIIVLCLKEQGVTNALSKLLLSETGNDGISFGFLSALSANLLNNIPMSVLFEGIIGGSSISAVYGAIIGSNIGAYLTPVGALAGIMWNKILSEYGVKLSFAKFILYGFTVAIFTLGATVLGLSMVI
jgi:arsenical pump membrane protein